MFEEKLALWQKKEESEILNYVNASQEKINLLEIFKKDKNLVSKFQKQALSDNEVKRLLTYIVAHFVENDKKMTNSDMEEISIQIELSFPGENKVCILYK